MRGRAEGLLDIPIQCCIGLDIGRYEVELADQIGMIIIITKSSGVELRESPWRRIIRGKR